VNTGDEVTVVAGSLYGAGVPPDSGNSVSFGGVGIDPARTFPAQTGTLYYSFLLSVSDLGGLDATGGYIAGFGSNSTNFGTTLSGPRSTVPAVISLHGKTDERPGGCFRHNHRAV
jgi:hypothetical protein